MNTRGAALCEGIATTPSLMAHGITEIETCPTMICVLACCWRSCRTTPRTSRRNLTWKENVPQKDVAHVCGTSTCAPRSARQAERRLGPPPAHGPHVPAGLPRRHRDGGACPAGTSGGPRHSGALQLRSLVDVVTVQQALGHARPEENCFGHSKSGFNTKLVHAGILEDTYGSIVAHLSGEHLRVPQRPGGSRSLRRRAEGYIYTRIGNPTICALEENVSQLENAPLHCHGERHGCRFGRSTWRS